ncbi:lysylphosphatidylglycerol synthase transmembrane domain-containing protein [Adlercreutzia sp. ZJ242]|uniref:lysylphosphatidylglycerol synthase transmembrane domain-containing protein n=1 Tax=Adlercreutzia sp. ZJ242 TaxID=2709409 RepID=UPI0013EC5783|nr:lysylphosphatidylglycerol synthase transmembrane domain-containing protein [Adlercreutzia sp. ZJ242]
MKKALLLILGIVTVCFLIANADYISNILTTMKTGALLPLVVSCILMLARHFVQAASYDAAFEAVGHRTGFWHNVILIYSLVFINTFCLFSGATGVAFIIDDARRQGCDAGQSTGGAILSQIGYFAAIFVISTIGFVTMLLAGQMNTLFLIGGLTLAGVLVVLSSMFFVGHLRPRVLFRFFIWLERPINAVLGLVRRSLKAAWGRHTAHSFVNTANILASNPKGTLITVGYASLSALLNMACLVAIGYSFGFENVAALVAAFAVAAISVILSPTPQGVGVVEAAIAAILTAYGCSLATATAIALVYRGIMFWAPFCIGAVLLSQSGFFTSKKTASEEQRHKDIGWISGTLVFLVGVVNIGLSFVPGTFAPFTMLTEWVDMSALFVGIPLIISSIVLIVCAVGLVMRFRTAWAITLSLLSIIAGAEFLFQGTIQVGVAGIALVAWLFFQRNAFDRPFSMEAVRASVEAGRKLRAERAAEKAKGAKEKPRPRVEKGAKGKPRPRVEKGAQAKPRGRSEK